MDSKYLIVKSFYCVWTEMGVKELKLDNNMLYCSVPKSSYLLDAHGNEMSGKLLAKRIIKTLSELGIPNMSISYTIRNEHWTKEKAKRAYEYAKTVANIAETLL